MSADSDWTPGRDEARRTDADGTERRALRQNLSAVCDELAASREQVELAQREATEAKAALTASKARIEVLTEIVVTGRRDDVDTLLMPRRDVENLYENEATARAENLMLKLALSAVDKICRDLGQSNDVDADRLADIIQAICTDALERT